MPGIPVVVVFLDLAPHTPVIFTLLLTQSWGGRSSEDLQSLAINLGQPPSLRGAVLYHHAYCGRACEALETGASCHPLTQESRKASAGYLGSPEKRFAAGV